MNDQSTLKKELERLQKQHTELDRELKTLMRKALPDYVQIQQTKKNKLDTKDQIEALKKQLLPDIIA